MQRDSVRRRLLAIAVMALVSAGMVPTDAHAEWVHEGQAKQGRWTAGLRAGLALPTQEMLRGTDTNLGPAVNAQIQYGLNRFFAVGFMVEWERRGWDQESPSGKIGTLNTISLMPTLEFRPGRLGAVMPYLSTGLGANVNTFNEASGVAKTSFGTTFAWRVASGLDYPLTDKLMLNAEIAWKRNRGGLDVGGTNVGSFDASTANLLFGVKYTF